MFNHKFRSSINKKELYEQLEEMYPNKKFKKVSFKKLYKKIKSR